MTSLCVNGSQDAVNVFFDEILNLTNNGVVIEAKGKEHQSTNGTIRKRVKVDILSFRGDIKDLKGTFSVSVRVVSDSKDELKRCIEILKEIAVVSYIPTDGITKLQTMRIANTMRYGISVSCIDKKTVAKRKLLGLKDDRFNSLK